MIFKPFLSGCLSLLLLLPLACCPPPQVKDLVPTLNRSVVGLTCKKSGDALSTIGGAGVVLDHHRQYLLTCCHLVDGGYDGDIEVELCTKEKCRAKVIAREKRWDLALLEADHYYGTSFPPAVRLGPGMADLCLGETLIVVGHPLSFRNSVTVGVLSGIDRELEMGTDEPVFGDLIQLDAAVNPGNSGGPVFNMQGELVGLVSAMHSGGQNLGFAVPVDSIRKFIRLHLSTVAVSNSRVFTTSSALYLTPWYRCLMPSGLNTSSRYPVTSPVRLSLNELPGVSPR